MFTGEGSTNTTSTLTVQRAPLRWRGKVRRLRTAQWCLRAATVVHGGGVEMTGASLLELATLPPGKLGVAGLWLSGPDRSPTPTPPLTDGCLSVIAKGDTRVRK